MATRIRGQKWVSWRRWARRHSEEEDIGMERDRDRKREGDR